MKARIFCIAALLSLAGSATAQTSTAFKDQFKLIKAPNAIAAVGADLFGDKVNLYNGGLEFIQNDVSLPGNNTLPVMIGRRLTAGQFAFNDRAFGKWNLEIPHLHGVFAASSRSALPGWVGRDGSDSRCSQFGAPPEAEGLQGSSRWGANEFWRGNFLYIPGQGDQQLLMRAPEYTRTPSEIIVDEVRVRTFPIVTSSHWAIGCLPTLKNSPTKGEGFLVVSPDGTKYKFDWLVNFQATTLTKTSTAPVPSISDGEQSVATSESILADSGGLPDEVISASSGELSAATSEPLVADGGEMPNVVMNPTLPRTEVWILPSKIIDRFGNTVTFTYDPDPNRSSNLLSISSSDGRTITITYVLDAEGVPTNRIRTVHDGTRTWTYNYETSLAGQLSTVILPDGARWNLAQAEQLLADVKYYNEPTYCTDSPPHFPITLKATLEHPTGATGTFTLIPTKHGRSRVPFVCVDKVLQTPIFYLTNSLASKTINGPGLPSMTWTYQWPNANGSFDNCTTCPGYELMTVTDPEGDVTRHIFGNQYFVDEGKRLRTDEGWDGTNALRTTQISYNPPSPDNPYPMQVGYTDELLGSGTSDLRFMPEKSHDSPTRSQLQLGR